MQVSWCHGLFAPWGEVGLYLLKKWSMNWHHPHHVGDSDCIFRISPDELNAQWCLRSDALKCGAWTWHVPPGSKVSSGQKQCVSLCPPPRTPKIYMEYRINVPRFFACCLTTPCYWLVANGKSDFICESFSHKWGYPVISRPFPWPMNGCGRTSEIITRNTILVPKSVPPLVSPIQSRSRNSMIIKAF